MLVCLLRTLCVCARALAHTPLAQGDRVIGNVQNMPCTASGAGCHSALRTLATLVLACPDVSHPTRVWDITSTSGGAKTKYLVKGGRGEVEGIKVPWTWFYEPSQLTTGQIERHERFWSNSKGNAASTSSIPARL